LNTKAKTRSSKIREHLLSLPAGRRSPTAVAKELTAKGCRVTRNHVSVVKSAMSNRWTISETKSLLLAKKFLEVAGSPAEARRLIGIVDRIVGR